MLSRLAAGAVQLRLGIVQLCLGVLELQILRDDLALLILLDQALCPVQHPLGGVIIRRSLLQDGEPALQLQPRDQQRLVL